MDLDKVDIWLSIIDMVICVSDIGFMVYLFFYKFPQEQKKSKFISRISPRKSRYR